MTVSIRLRQFALILLLGACADPAGGLLEPTTATDPDPDSADQASSPDTGPDTHVDVTSVDRADSGEDAPPDTVDGEAGDAATADVAADLDAGSDVPHESPDPVPLVPCDQGACWDTGLIAPICGTATVDEDFSTGRYNVHAYAARAQGIGETRFALIRTGGTWQPRLILAQPDGTVLFDGEIGRVREGLEVVLIDDGGAGQQAIVDVTTDTDLDLVAFVTSWDVVDSGFTDALPVDSTYTIQTQVSCDEQPGRIAPAGAMPGEQALVGTQTIDVSAEWGPPMRVDAAQSEHIGFRLDFSPSGAAADLELQMWDGAEAVQIGYTDGGPGLRVIAAFDPYAARTFWVRARGSVSEGELSVVRSALLAGPTCEVDCARLMQLPEPVDAQRQGFDMAPYHRYREQFARRELLMAILHAAGRVADAGYGPITVQDLSNWDGSKPPGHQTHNDGYHADISLLRSDGTATWFDPGDDFGDVPMAYLLAGFFEAGPYATGNPAQIILDSGFHDDVEQGAETLLDRGEITSDVAELLGTDADLIYHYRGHADHIHVRIDR